MREPTTETCQKHGDYQRGDYGPYECPSCRRDGFVQGSLERSGIPARYQSARPSKLEADFLGVMEWANQAVTAEAPGPLCLVGPPGTGKSYAACAALIHWVHKTGGRSGVYATASEMARQVRATWARNSEHSEAAVLSKFAGAELLVLDDLGAGKLADAEIVQEVVGARYDADRMSETIIATNFAAREWDRVFGERVADRLRHGATLVEVVGASRRRPAA